MPEIALNPPPFNPQGEKGESGYSDDQNGSRSQRCMRAGRPRFQGVRPVIYATHCGDHHLCAAVCGRDAHAPRRCVPLCCCVQAGCPRTQAVRTFVLLCAGGALAHPGGAYLCATACGRDARAPRRCALKCRVFGRDERCSAFPCAVAPHPPNPLLPQGEKGESGRSDA